jgi:hypothetical protein
MSGTVTRELDFHRYLAIVVGAAAIAQLTRSWPGYALDDWRLYALSWRMKQATMRWTRSVGARPACATETSSPRTPPALWPLLVASILLALGLGAFSATTMAGPSSPLYGVHRSVESAYASAPRPARSSHASFKISNARAASPVAHARCLRARGGRRCQAAATDACVGARRTRPST